MECCFCLLETIDSDNLQEKVTGPAAAKLLMNNCFLPLGNKESDIIMAKHMSCYYKACVTSFHICANSFHTIRRCALTARCMFVNTISFALKDGHYDFFTFWRAF